jgi:hypothetical protein
MSPIAGDVDTRSSFCTPSTRFSPSLELPLIYNGRGGVDLRHAIEMIDPMHAISSLVGFPSILVAFGAPSIRGIQVLEGPRVL